LEKAIIIIKALDLTSRACLWNGQVRYLDVRQVSFLVGHRMMKRIAIIIVVLLMCLAGICTAWWISDPAVHCKKIVTAFQGHFGRNDDGQSCDRTWIPWSVRNHPRRVYLDWKRSRIRFATGFPNMDMGFHDYTGSHHIVLSIHLYENFARGITISSEAKDKGRAEEIRRMIETMFPRLPARIEEKKAQPASLAAHPPPLGGFMDATRHEGIVK